ncbi:protein LURP-one-related 15-like [Beta vulgaris subsp. vulgaris]|uniref:protein LURP-one-related 15-like n=1 Tax=Beta vulgaris subsp. vulgaris TaxID=3555 RepID=UPI00203743DF|nr:protein LURP-one-related 15-like [Beta vulgaris subsp. vulgaris]
MGITQALLDKHRWDIYRGESMEKQDLLFSAKRTSYMYARSRVDVFLPDNHNNQVGDFHIIATFTTDSWNMYHGTVLIAQVCRLTDKHRWEVYGGDSTDAPDYMFKVQRTKAFQVKARLDVFFLDNPNSEEGKFQIKEDELSSHTASMYQGSTIIARIEHKTSWNKILKGKDELMVEVCEGVDYAFVMAVLIIMVMLVDRK